MMMMMRGI